MPCDIFSVRLAVAVLVYILLAAPPMLTMHLLRNTPSMRKRSSRLCLLFCALCILNGFADVIGLTCGRTRSNLYILLEACLSYLTVPAIIFIFYLRLVIFMEIEIRNQSFLMLARNSGGAGGSSSSSSSGTTGAVSQYINRKQLAFGQVDRIFLKFLGFRNTVTQVVGAASSETISFSISRVFRALMLNIGFFVSVLIVIGTIFSLIVGTDAESQARNVRFLWSGLTVASLPYLLYCMYFIFRILGIKDTYMIRTEIISVVSVVPPGILLFTYGVLSDTNYLPVFENISLFLTGKLYITMACYFGTVICTLCSHLRLARRQRDRVEGRMPLEEFELALNNKDFLKTLTPQLAADYCMENAIFILEYDGLIATSKSIIIFLDKSPSMSASTALVPMTSGANTPQNDRVQALCDRFIRSEAPYELNIPHELREGLLESERLRKLTLADFAQVRRQVAFMIYQNTYPRYLMQLQQQRQMAGAAPTPKNTDPSGQV